MKLDWKNLLKIGLSIFLLYLAIHYWPRVSNFLYLIFKAAIPIIIGCVIAYILNLLLTLYERNFFTKSTKSTKSIIRKIRRPVCLILSIITLLAIISLVIGLVVPQLISCVKLIAKELPDAINVSANWLERLNIISHDVVDLLTSIDWQSKIGQIANALTSGIGNVMDIVIGTVTSVFSGIVTAFLSIIFAVYLLMGKDKLANQATRLMRHYIPAKWYSKTAYTLSVFNDCFKRYIVGQCTEAVILGILCMIGMLILQIPYAAMISALIAFTALIPIAGAYIGAAIGAFMILTVSPIKALIFIIFLVVLQQIEGNLIYPRVVGSSLGLPAIWVLAAVTVGGGILGIPGMLLGVPVAASLYRLIKESLSKSEKT